MILTTPIRKLHSGRDTVPAKSTNPVLPVIAPITEIAGVNIAVVHVIANKPQETKLLSVSSRLEASPTAG